MVNRLVILILLLLSFGDAVSQVINIEGRRFLKDSNGFVGRVNLNYNITKNVQSLVILGSNVHAQHRKDRQRILIIGDFSFIKAGLQDFVNSGYQHLRYNCRIGKLVTAEAFVQAQYNNVLLLDRRYLSGAGPRFTIITKEQARLYVGSLYMYEYQSQNKDSVHQYNHRISSYFTLNLSYHGIDFTSTSYYQPKIGEISNFRIANDSSLEFEIYGKYSFRTGINLLFDTAQPIGVPALTYIIKNGLSYRF